ncbi:esterase/lipase family protein [Gordonia sp. NPDC003425]
MRVNVNQRWRAGVIAALALLTLALLTPASLTPALLTIVGGPAVASAAPAAPPVARDSGDGTGAELANPGGSLAGTNDFGCRPTPQHPRPVVLLHGVGGGRQTNWAGLAPVLHDEGYCVFAPTYTPLGASWPASAVGGLDYKTESAWQVKEFVDKVLRETGADQVNIVSHSLGTEVGVYWMKYYGGAPRVAHYVSLAPYWRQGHDLGDTRSDVIGALKDRLGRQRRADPTCAGCTPPPAGTDFHDAVRVPSPYQRGIRYTNIVTRYDEVNAHYTDGLLPGPPGTDVTNITVQDGCAADHSDHLSLVYDRRAAALVLNALDPAHPRPVPCVAVAPFTGG